MVEELDGLLAGGVDIEGDSFCPGGILSLVWRNGTDVSVYLKGWVMEKWKVQVERAASGPW